MKSRRTYSLKSTPSDKFFEKLFMTISFTIRVFTRNLLRGNHRRNTFTILFWYLACGLNPGFSSNKPTHYQLNYGDFIFIFRFIGDVWVDVWIMASRLILDYVIQSALSVNCTCHQLGQSAKVIIDECQTEMCWRKQYQAVRQTTWRWITRMQKSILTRENIYKNDRSTPPFKLYTV